MKEYSATCPKCKTDFISTIAPDGYKKRYCSRSCANSRTWSTEDRQKKSKSLNYTRIRFYTCHICNKVHYKTGKNIKRGKNLTHLACSAECLHIARSKNAYKALAVRTKTSRSALEIEFYELVKKHFPNATHNKIIVKCWDADVILEDQKVAILWNGPWHYQEMPGLTHSLKQTQNRDSLKIKELSAAGWKVYVYEDRIFTPKQALADLLQQVPLLSNPL